LTVLLIGNLTAVFDDLMRMLNPIRSRVLGFVINRELDAISAVAQSQHAEVELEIIRSTVRFQDFVMNYSDMLQQAMSRADIDTAVQATTDEIGLDAAKIRQIISSFVAEGNKIRDRLYQTEKDHLNPVVNAT